MDQLLPKLDHCGIPAILTPFVIALTGDGRTSKGILDILQHLPNIEIIDPDALPGLFEKPKKLNKIYITTIKPQHMVERLDGGSWDKQHYYKKP